MRINMKLKKYWVIFLALFVLAMIGMFQAGNGLQNGKTVKTLTFPAFKEQVEKIAKQKNNNDKTTYLFEGQDGTIYLFTPNITYKTKVDPLAGSSKELYQPNDIRYEKEEASSWLGTTIRYLLLFVFLYFIFSFLSPGGKLGGKWGGKQAKEQTSIPTIKLDEVGGLHEETKEQFRQIITMFKDKERAKQLGIRPPRGALLYGPPGTGKTRSALAIASEMGATIYSLSGSEFVEMFVGVGASRVRELFEKARKTAPSLIFIDEIDSIAKKRSNGPVGNEERESTLNELLKQMNGIQENEDVFLIGATNRMDMLDEAILRPGRFDYRIYIGLPDLKGRREIVDIHSKGKALSEEVKTKLDYIASSTAGFSGAQIEGIFNDAAKMALREGRNIIEMEDIDKAVDILILGNQRNVHLYQYQQRRIAIHEAGHAVVTCITDPQSIRKLTVTPRGQALGYMASFGREVEFLTTSELLNEVKKCLGGGVAEQIFFGEHSNGVSGDVEQAKQLLEHMVKSGMEPKHFRLQFKKEEQEEMMRTWYAKAYSDTVEILSKHKEAVQRLADTLLEQKTLNGDDVRTLVLQSPQASA